MNRRFVICVEGLSRAEQNKLREFLRAHGAWWHWIDNFWLLSLRSDDDDDLEVVQIRDEIRKINRDARSIIFEFPEDIAWAGSGKKNAKGKSMFKWLKSAWARE
jgi:hypothetical protein